MPVTINEFEIVPAVQQTPPTPTDVPVERPAPTEAEQRRQLERQLRRQKQRALRTRVY